MRTGVFGGTFDPVHKGHLNIANAALDQAALDRILFVVAAKPPHKRNNQLTETALRVQMVEAALPTIRPFRSVSWKLNGKAIPLQPIP